MGTIIDIINMGEVWILTVDCDGRIFTVPVAPDPDRYRVGDTVEAY